MKLHRRDFIRHLAGASGVALIGGGFGCQQGNPPTPPGKASIEHIVVVTMENRSFDHFLGWLPNADGQQKNTYPVPNSTNTVSTYTLAPDYQGCGHPDPDHSYLGGRVEYNNGQMNGWLLDPSNDQFCLGYYQESDLLFFAVLARNYTTLDHYFCSILGPTFPNRLFLLTGQTDRLDDSVIPTDLPSIFDRLESAGVSARYYYDNVPFLSLWGVKYVLISHTYDSFLADAASGKLPAVSFVDPRFSIDVNGDTANDDHPRTDIRRGDAFLSTTFQAVAMSPLWSSTVFIVTFDEWGGFFDHIAPPRAAAPNNADADLINGKALLGFRVPTVVASPWTRGNPADPLVNHTVFDHTSILKLIEWNWGLSPMTSRDGSSDIANLNAVLDLSQKNMQVPSLPNPPVPPATPCSTTTTAPLGATAFHQGTPAAWSNLVNSGLLQGWDVKPR